MSKIEKAQLSLALIERASREESVLGNIDPRAKLLVILLYLVAVLSFPLHSVAPLIVFAIYPIVASAMSGTPFETIFRKSLYVLPFIAFIGIFNPLMHREAALVVGGVVVSEGWLEFISILLRGLLTVQGVLVLIYSTDFYRLCHALTRMGIPAIFASQLMFVYRYLFVLIDEAVSMDRARRSRSYGRRHYSLRLYGIFVGQLLLRTVERSRRIYDAMLSRGFDCSLPATGGHSHWTRRDTLFLLIWALLFAAARLLNVAAVFSNY